MTVVTLSLISHTNVGKTTLARTLLRRDVGEVRDAPHVTDASEAFTLLETGDARLRLWDTPGFGNLVPLMRRLRAERNPLGWFLHHVWDRVIDRPLFCSQQAARNVRESADIVLYLVNAAEDPHDAGYVHPELELLGWIERPVLVLLNQVGDAAEAELIPRWRELAARHPIIRDVVSLDAYARCWLHEGLMLARVVEMLADGKRPAMRELAAAWDRRNLETFDAAVTLLARYLVETAADREPDAGGRVRDLLRAGAERLGAPAPPAGNAMRELSERLDTRTTALSSTLVALHGLDRRSELEIQRDLDDDTRQRGLALGDGAGALLGAVLGAVPTGLAADLASGGLSLGGGMIAGGILGALGGSALARGYRWVSGAEPAVSWTDRFITRLARQSMLRYLAVAHWGRGRGPFAERALAVHWVERVERELENERGALEPVWSAAAKLSADDEAARAALTARAARAIGTALRRVLASAYPDAAGRLERSSL